jgi:flagellar motor switch protein FliN/FliY
MAEDMEFDSFENLDDLDWSELEKGIQEEGQSEQDGAAADVGADQQDSGRHSTTAGVIGSGSTKQVEIGYLLDVNLQVTVEIGKTNTFISNVLSWDNGSIIELDKLVGEPLDLLVNNKQVAKGEVVVVNEKFALKIVEILDPRDRMNYLQS